MPISNVEQVVRKRYGTGARTRVADEPVPASMQNDPDLWTDCISGAFTESGSLTAFEEAGFHGIRVLRGQRYAVCDKTFRIFSQEPYRDSFELVTPRIEIPLSEASAFDCSRTEPRHPAETKGEGNRFTSAGDSPCCTAEDCC